MTFAPQSSGFEIDWGSDDEPLREDPDHEAW